MEYLLSNDTIDSNAAVPLLSEEFHGDRRYARDALGSAENDGFLERVEKGVYKITDIGKRYIEAVLLPRKSEYKGKIISRRRDLLAYLERNPSSKEAIRKLVTDMHIFHAANRVGLINIGNDGKYHLTLGGTENLRK